MKIAYISYEHPLGISGGGIGTYIGQISKAMSLIGHHVEVFCATKNNFFQSIEYQGYILHLIPCIDRKNFKYDVLPCFDKINKISCFDLVESPEYGADGLMIKKKYKSIPLVVKCHTPQFFLTYYNNWNLNLLAKTRFILGSLKRLKKPKLYWKYQKTDDIEYQIAQIADSVNSPSKSLAKILSNKWLDSKDIFVLPYPFEISKEILAIRPPVTENFVVTFIGKLEKRKGIMDLAKAIPMVLAKFPDIKFQFIGSIHDSPKKGMNMQEYLESQLSKHSSSLQFKGFISYEMIPEILEKSTICVFPSLWENFPNVCLEAMAAQRAVIGTNNGGMADMIYDGMDGILIPKGKPYSIALAIMNLYSDRELLIKICKNARIKIIEKYNPRIIGEETTKYYDSIIELVKLTNNNDQ